MKILMIGNKESGKTTYMASAFGVLNDGISGFYIHTDTTTREWFQRLYKQIGRGYYPDYTDKRGSYHFQLFHNQRSVLDFDWIDYNGGVITDTSIEKLKNDIYTADGMMIFLDAEALLNNDIVTHRFRRIIALISEKLESGDSPLFSVIIVLTKYDKLPADTDIESVTKSIKPFIDDADENEKLYIRVVPVSCTEKGFYNVDLPLLDILDSGLRLSILTAAFEAKYYTEQFADRANKTGVIDWGVSRLMGLKTNGELAKEYRNKALERIALFETIKMPMEILSDYVANYVVTYPKGGGISKKITRRQSTVDFIDL